MVYEAGGSDSGTIHWKELALFTCVAISTTGLCSHASKHKSATALMTGIKAIGV
jgi:hypothetical protein